MAIKPITPFEVVKAKQDTLPDEAIKAFNDMIAEKWDGHSSHFKQDDVLNKMVELLMAQQYSTSTKPSVREMIFDKHWLDVEPIFRKAGWVVEYDKPGYNETYSATFTFRRKKKQSTD